jgi:catechol 2,3-dioxygenase-like lactoylglutathione lyase family enzyme
MPQINIKAIDHIVMTCGDIEKTVAFYTFALGMKVHCFGNNRFALRFGNQKINLHQVGNEFEPKAKLPTPGSVDVCFITETPLDEVKSYLESNGINILEGPIEKIGAMGKIYSIYFRDPDKNLIEVSNYI